MNMIKGLVYEYNTSSPSVMLAVTRLFRKQFEHRNGIMEIKPSLDYDEMNNDILTILMDTIGYDAVTVDMVGDLLPIINIYIESFVINVNVGLDYKIVFN